MESDNTRYSLASKTLDEPLKRNANKIPRKLGDEKPDEKVDPVPSAKEQAKWHIKEACLSLAVSVLKKPSDAFFTGICLVAITGLFWAHKYKPTRKVLMSIYGIILTLSYAGIFLFFVADMLRVKWWHCSGTAIVFLFSLFLVGCNRLFKTSAYFSPIGPFIDSYGVRMARSLERFGRQFTA
eukprot:TRINITY_DN22355_c0_g1_i1.p1 TRINITY_DN22355_c0_g1~~TRINITY_DN22355_c0_g1_i1.p1  ORF type:complete len:200 (+),score=16.38 TRINITY_DN22355_c0_g1_i1:57-602(+)